MYCTFSNKLDTDYVRYYQTLSNCEIDKFTELVDEFLAESKISVITDEILMSFPKVFHHWLSQKVENSQDRYFKQVRVNMFTQLQTQNGVIDNNTLEIVKCPFGGHFNALNILLAKENHELYQSYLNTTTSHLDKFRDFPELDQHVSENYTFVHELENITF